jgi:ribosomal protein L31E
MRALKNVGRNRKSPYAITFMKGFLTLKNGRGGRI